MVLSMNLDLKVGFELEFPGPHDAYTAIRDDKFDRTFDCTVKHDENDENTTGCELNSPAFVMSEIDTILDYMFNTYNSVFIVPSHNTGGIHVHIDWINLSLYDNIQDFIFNNVRFWKKISKRTTIPYSNKWMWCKFRRESEYGIVRENHVSIYKNGVRSLRSIHTIEIRAFNSSLDREEIKSCIEMTYGLYFIKNNTTLWEYFDILKELKFNAALNRIVNTTGRTYLKDWHV